MLGCRPAHRVACTAADAKAKAAADTKVTPKYIKADSLAAGESGYFGASSVSGGAQSTLVACLPFCFTAAAAHSLAHYPRPAGRRRRAGQSGRLQEGCLHLHRREDRGGAHAPLEPARCSPGLLPLLSAHTLAWLCPRAVQADIATKGRESAAAAALVFAGQP